MNGDDFHRAAGAATASVTFDPAATLRDVYDVHRRRTRARRLMIGVPVAAALAVGGVTLPSIIAPQTGESALAAYAFADAPDGAPAAAVVDGVALHHLPTETPAEPVSLTQTAYGADGTSTTACFEDDCTSGLGVVVTRAAGLTLDGYLRTSWFPDPVETTVGGRPALANGVQADDASGLVWSPADGVVVEVHVGHGRAAELRDVVEQMSL